MISAKVIADSKNEFGNRITTMVVTFPRIILAEFNTHRMLSKNSASSRAIPFDKMVKSVEENPFIPIAWQEDHKGMQGTEYFTNWEEISMNNLDWLTARDNAVNEAKNLANRGVTKQLCNRLLEPFMWHTVIVTATEWENFFALRCPQYIYGDKIFRSKKDWIKEASLGAEENYWWNRTEVDWLKINKGQAEIHMMALAEVMWDAYNGSTPKELKAGEWHIPFGDNIDISKIWNITNFEFKGVVNEKLSSKEQNIAIKIATARCARVSYTVVGEGADDSLNKKSNILYENDIKLHDRLAASGHWSPFEHCARAMSTDDRDHIDGIYSPTKGQWSGNFRGFIQYRKMFNNENITK